MCGVCAIKLFIFSEVSGYVLKGGSISRVESPATANERGERSFDKERRAFTIANGGVIN